MVERKIGINKLKLSVLNEIKEFYIHKKWSAKRIATYFDINQAGVLSFLKKNNIKIRDTSFTQRKYSLNEDFFNKINSEEKAYFLGFLYADGFFNPYLHFFTLQVAEQDKSILDRLKDLLKSNRPITCFDPKNSMKANTCKLQKMYGMKINSRKISNKLCKFGLHKNKSFTIKFPSSNIIPSKFVRHFIRGYYDGDGCLVLSSKRKNKIKKDGALTIISTKNFCEGLLLKAKELNVKAFIYSVFNRKTDNTYFNFRIGGNPQIIKFLDWIYRDSKIYLTRKFEIFKYFLLLICQTKRYSSSKFLVRKNNIDLIYLGKKYI